MTVEDIEDLEIPLVPNPLEIGLVINVKSCQLPNIIVLQENVKRRIPPVLEEWLKKFKDRRNYLIEFFNSIPGLNPFFPSGAFYLYVSCKGFIKKKLNNGKEIKNDIDFAENLLMDAKVAVVPGTAFGKSPYFRISYATSLSDLKEACERINNSLKKIT